MNYCDSEKLTSGQVARMLNYSRSHVLYLAGSGRIPSVQFGPNARHIFLKHEIESLLKNHHTKTRRKRSY